ncbi:phosphoglycerol transferase I [Pseudoxanthomonas sangjuensis]|uniref:phosphoglycerol transferase I n=1 Tax=Pseudoxanthomonas sangjuensis TaxID=1503750 RepID=UPI00139143AE|nr:phosphoglycerol transferase I [Pseudoxanthomonas sangjuensis]KAF1713423.1 phosphoglycerol transferase I [Pseudoxanthomonas sangjuensis]
MHPLLPLALVALLCLLAASRKWIWTKAALLALLLLALSAWWLVDRLSGDGINAATLYHLRAGVDGAGISDFSDQIAAFLALAAVSLVVPLGLAWLSPARGGGRRGALALAGFVALFALTVRFSPLYTDGQRIARSLRPADAAAVAAEYRQPAVPLRNRKNIVWIYGESLERTYLDPQAFPGLMPNLSRLAGEALDFRDVASAEGSGWTIAGLVASMCGVPLTTAPGDENSMGRMDQFLPGAHCLGDYLKEQGYATRFLGGADADFAAKGAFLASHGFDRVKEKNDYRAAGVSRRHFSNWGVHDDVLLDDAWDSFQQLSRAGRPFLLTALTMDTHHPAGHLPVSCRDIRYDSPYGDIGLLKALKCSDRLISRLVERIRRSPWADDTIIVVASDHLAMPNDLSEVLAGLHRENLLLFLGPGIRPRSIARGGSTLDSGATLLQLLDPDKQALGFGRSLLAAGATASASAAASRDGGKDYPRYLAFARQLWTGTDTRTLRVDDDGRVVVGRQRIQPPLMLEYDRDWNIRAMVLNDAPRQFIDRQPDNVLAYVDRCTAFLDDSLRGEWCAALWDRNDNLQLYTGAQLRHGVQVSASPAYTDVPRPRPRRPLTIGVEDQRMRAGGYQLLLRARDLPAHPFWLEAVSSQGRVIHAREWIQPGAQAGDLLRLPLWLDTSVEGLEVRAWLDYTEFIQVDRMAVVRDRNARVAQATHG